LSQNYALVPKYLANLEAVSTVIAFLPRKMPQARRGDAYPLGELYGVISRGSTNSGSRTLPGCIGG
jgi:hypothetical protein